MHGVEVVFAPGNRRVWRANGFYNEQILPERQGERLGDRTNLVIVQRPISEYKPWNPDDPETHESEKVPPTAILSDTVLARIPTGRYCWVGLIELDEAGGAPARRHEDLGWDLPAVTAEPAPSEPLPTSVVGPSKLPTAPQRTRKGV